MLAYCCEVGPGYWLGSFVRHREWCDCVERNEEVLVREEESEAKVSAQALACINQRHRVRDYAQVMLVRGLEHL